MAEINDKTNLVIEYLTKVEMLAKQRPMSEKYFQEFKINFLEEWSDFLQSAHGKATDISLQKEFLSDKEDVEVLASSLAGPITTNNNYSFYKDVFNGSFWIKPFQYYLVLTAIKMILTSSYNIITGAYFAQLYNYIDLLSFDLSVIPIIYFIGLTIYKASNSNYNLAKITLLRSLYSITLFAMYLIVDGYYQIFEMFEWARATNSNLIPDLYKIEFIVILIISIVSILLLIISIFILKLINKTEIEFSNEFFDNKKALLWSIPVRLNIVYTLCYFSALLVYKLNNLIGQPLQYLPIQSLMDTFRDLLSSFYIHLKFLQS